MSNRAFRFVLFLLLIIGVAVLFVGGLEWLDPVWDRFAVPIGEAVLIAVILAATVDQFVKRKFARDTAEDVIAAIYGRKAPPEYVDSLEQYLSDIDRVMMNGKWVIDLASADQGSAVKITVSAFIRGKNISATNIKGPSKLWLIPSVGDHESAIVSYRCRVPSRTKSRMHLRSSELMEAAVRQPDGGLLVPLSKLTRKLTIHPSEEFEIEIEAMYHRRISDYFPIVPQYPYLRQEIRVAGDALPTLDLEVRHANDALSNTSSDAHETTYEIPRVTFPGQATLLFWRERTSTIAS